MFDDNRISTLLPEPDVIKMNVTSFYPSLLYTIPKVATFQDHALGVDSFEPGQTKRVHFSPSKRATSS